MCRVANVKDGHPLAVDAPVARQLHRERELVVLERVDGGHLVTFGSNDGTSYVQRASVGRLTAHGCRLIAIHPVNPIAQVAPVAAGGFDFAPARVPGIAGSCWAALLVGAV